MKLARAGADEELATVDLWHALLEPEAGSFKLEKDLDMGGVIPPKVGNESPLKRSTPIVISMG